MMTKEVWATAATAASCRVGVEISGTRERENRLGGGEDEAKSSGLVVSALTLVSHSFARDSGLEC